MKNISSFFTNNGTPLTGLSPTIRIWDITGGANTLVVNNDPLVEVGDGFYTYDFSTYDPQLDYLFRTDGGATVPLSNRYQSGSNRNDADEVWNANSNDYTGINTTGLKLNELRADMTTALSIVQELLQYECGRTVVDPIAMTLTIFDADNTTPIKVFDLLDENGVASSDCVYERLPQP